MRNYFFNSSFWLLAASVPPFAQRIYHDQVDPHWLQARMA